MPPRPRTASAAARMVAAAQARPRPIDPPRLGNNPQSSLVRTDASPTDPLAYKVEPPVTPAPGTSYGDMVLLEVFGRDSAVRAQKTRKLDPKTEQWVAANSEYLTRNRPEFIRQVMLSGNEELMDLVARGFRDASPERQTKLLQEIAERMPNPRAEGAIAFGWSPEALEVVDFLNTGRISPERARSIAEVRALEDGSIAPPSEVRSLPGGEVAQDFRVDSDLRLDTAPESNVPLLPAPGDPILTEGVRPFRKPQGMGEGLRDKLDSRPGTRAGKTQVASEGDKINPRTERYDTRLVPGPDGQLIPVRQAQGEPTWSAQDNPAINAARRYEETEGRARPPYFDRNPNTADRRAARALQSEQQILADNLAAMWNGDLAAADRVWNMVKLKTNKSPRPPSAEGLIDYALSLLTDQDSLARALAGQSPDTARAQMIDVANNRFFPEGRSRTLTREQAAAEDAAAGRQPKSDPFPQGLDDNLRPRSAIPGRGPGGTPMNRDIPDGPGRRENLDAIADKGPILPGLPRRPDHVYDDGEGNIQEAALSPQSEREIAARRLADAAHMRGEVVFLDEQGRLMKQGITERLLEKYPDRVAAIRRGAMERLSGQVSEQALARDPEAASKVAAEFNYYWPDGGAPLPEYFAWVRSVDPSSPRGLTQQQADAVAARSNPRPEMRADQAEIDQTLAGFRADDAASLASARARYAEFGMDAPMRLPPGWIRRPDGTPVRTRYLFSDEPTLDVGDMPVPASRLSPVESTELARLIIDDPTASPAELNWARKWYRQVTESLAAVGDEEVRASLRTELLDPMDQAVARRKGAAPPNVSDNLEGAAPSSSPAEPVAAGQAAVGDPDAPAITDGTNYIDSVNADLDAAATPIGGTPDEALLGAGPEAEAAIDEILEAQGRQPPQPSAQSADNGKPQEPPAPIEDDAAATAAAQKAASDAEAQKAAEAAAPAGAIDPAGANATPVPSQAGPSPAPAPPGPSPAPAPPGPSPAPAPPAAPPRGFLGRTYDTLAAVPAHLYRNKFRYGTGAAGLYALASGWNAVTTSNPYPGALDPFTPEDPAGGEPMAGGGEFYDQGQGGMAPMSSEERIRMLMRRGASGAPSRDEYPVQTLWRRY